MGIQKKLFMAFKTPSTIRDFFCDKCGDVLYEPVSLDPCEHMICKTCRGLGLGTSSAQAECPVDRCGQKITVQKEPPRPYVNELNSLTLLCPFDQDREGQESDCMGSSRHCWWRGSLGELVDHRKTCKCHPDNVTQLCVKGCGGLVAKGKQDHDCMQYLKDEVATGKLLFKRSKGALIQSERQAEEAVKRAESAETRLKTVEDKLKMSEDKVEAAGKKLKTVEEELKVTRQMHKLTQDELTTAKHDELEVRKDNEKGSRKRAHDQSPGASTQELKESKESSSSTADPGNVEAAGAAEGAGLNSGKRVRGSSHGSKISPGTIAQLKAARRQQTTKGNGTI